MSWTQIPLTSPPFQPLQNPLHPSTSSDGTSLTLRTGHGTDYWRVPFPPPGRDSSDAGLWAFRREVGVEGFEVRCEIDVKDPKLQVSFEQAAILLQLSPTEWVKVGAEFNHGKLWHGVVVCNPISDWSIQPASPKHRFTISFDPSQTTLRVYLTDSEGQDMLIREVKSFGLASAGLGHVVPGQVEDGVDPAEKLKGKEVVIALLGCSPLGKDEGPECVFGRFEIREGTREEA